MRGRTHCHGDRPRQGPGDMRAGWCAVRSASLAVGVVGGFQSFCSVGNTLAANSSSEARAMSTSMLEK